MTYKIKSFKEKEPVFSEDAEYYLVDLGNQTYDNHLVKGWKKAINLNLAYQLSSGNDYVIPVEKSEVLKHKELKNKNFL